MEAPGWSAQILETKAATRPEVDRPQVEAGKAGFLREPASVGMPG